VIYTSKQQPQFFPVRNSGECVGEGYCSIGPFASGITCLTVFLNTLAIKTCWENSQKRTRNNKRKSILVNCKRLWYIHVAIILSVCPSQFGVHRKMAQYISWICRFYCCCSFACGCAMWVKFISSRVFWFKKFCCVSCRGTQRRFVSNSSY